MAEIGLSFMPESDPDVRNLRRHFLQLVKEATQTTEKLHRFPGTMPLTLSRRHLPMICKNDYVALEKSDGTRYMLLALADYVVLIDRQMRFYKIEPNPRILDKGFVNPQENTLLDGELTLNMMTEQFDYLIYDAVAINGDTRVASYGFRERMQAAEIYVAGPRLWAPFCAGLLRLRIKDYYEKHNMRGLFSKIRKDPKGHYIYMNNDRRDGILCNANDGVIFSPVGMSYQVRNCPALLKWKPPHLNSVDFLLQLEKKVDVRRNNQPDIKSFIAYQGERGVCRLREIFLPSKIRRLFTADFPKYNNSIVEFSYDRIAGEWRYIRQREDKINPNFSSTVIDTMETIAESMEREELVRYLEKNSPPLPIAEKSFIEAVARNVKECTFRDDCFDESNEEYVLATPMSLIGIPQMAVPEGRRQHRRYQNSSRPRLANGGSHAIIDPVPPTSRAPMEYPEDV